MLAAVLNAFGEKLEIADLELAPPGPGEVEVAIRASGVCHSDWNTISGATPSVVPAVLGHEGAGVVERVGDGVEDLRPGDRVVLSWLPACSRCRQCRSGRPNLCEAADAAMFAGTLLDGSIRLSRGGAAVHHYSLLSTFAERAVVPAASCVKIRDDVPLTVAALVGCAVTTGIGAVVRRARVEAGSTAVVFGAGGVGLSVVQGCHLAGAAAIAVVDPVEAKRRTARELGATHAFDPAADDPVAAVCELTHGGADYGFEAAGIPAVMRQTFEAVRRGGTVVYIGLPDEGASVALPGSEVVRGERIVTGSYYGSTSAADDMPAILDLYAAGRLDLDRLVSRTYRLEEINEAFADMLAGRVARGVITFDGADA